MLRYVTLPAGAPNPRSQLVIVQVPFLLALSIVNENRKDYMNKGSRKQESLCTSDDSLNVGRHLHILNGSFKS